MELFDQIEQSKSAIQKIWNSTPEVGLILGTGLGGFAGEIEQEAAIAYKDIPHFPVSTAPTHTGRMICGKIGSRKVVAMEGRFHFYEGYTMQQITLPVRVLKALGCKYLIVSNACGGMNPQYSKGEIMFIEDHINLMGDNPLIGKNDDRLGVRFPDMCHTFDPELIKLALETSVEAK
ncbi:MAG: purine-nucleoside phosphorylase, partial [Planctomycetia bacterium]